MKLLKVSFIIAVAVMAIIGISAPSYAFHDGGVATCESCHTMHNSYQQGAMSGQKSTTVGAYGTGNPAGSAIFLLRGTDQSSTCLNCHEGPTLSSYHVSTPLASLVNSAPVNRGPGGDFGWLRVATTTSTSSPIDRHGHNIVAADFGYTADAKNLTAPSGIPGTGFDATQLSCISCHNPHNSLRRIDQNGTQVTTGAPIVASGSYADSPVATSTAAVGVYRFLRGANAAPKSYNFNFLVTAPDAVAPKSYNRTEAVSDTVVAYGQGMSQWCGNCHGTFYDTAYSSGNNGHGHPTNVTLNQDSIMTNYNSYVKTGDMSSGGRGAGFSSLVPVELQRAGGVDYNALMTFATNTAGNYPVTANAGVMCLSCHRAHASGFESMTRFYVKGTITDTAGQYTLASGQTTTLQVQAAYYDRANTVFATYQRTLCNKCHAKD